MAGRRPKTLKGHDTRALGPSGSSDSGSDVGAPGTDALVGDLGMDAGRGNAPLTQVGAPDPELRNSPIIDESEYDEQAASRDLELEQGVCYFNGEAYPIGSYVQSGYELLECTGGGVWARMADREGPE